MAAAIREPGVLSRDLRRSRWVLAALALLGLVLSLLGARRDAEQVAVLERVRFSEAVSSHQAQIQAHLSARETLMGSVAALFNPGEPIRPDALGPYGRNFLSLSPEVTAISWLPAVAPERMPALMAAIRASGVENPSVFGQNRQPLDPATLGYVPHVILDVAPRDANSSVLLGGSPSDWPERRSAIELARSTRRVVTPGATRLFQSPFPFAFLLYAPVFSERGTYLGALSFAYRVEALLLAPALRSQASPRPFAVHVYDTSQADRRVHLVSIGRGGDLGSAAAFEDAARHPEGEFRSVQFGGLSLSLAYLPVEPIAAGVATRFTFFAATGIGLTFAVVLTVLLIQLNARRLAEEVGARRSAEARLHVLIQELNHRVRNVLTVAQSIIVRSLRPGMPLEEVRDTVIGRYQALATVMSLLTQSDWRGAGIEEIVEAELLPYAGRARCRGPALFLRPRAAQTLTLLVHELVTNSAKYGALSAAEGLVEVAWEAEDGRFVLGWSEHGGPPVAPPERRGFGSQIIERVAPQDLDGTCRLDYDPGGLRYRLETPLAEVVEDGTDGRGP